MRCKAISLHRPLQTARHFRSAKVQTIACIATIALASCLLTIQAEAQVARTYVSGLGNDANPCTVSAPCKTLQGALSKTSPGGEIDTLNSANYGSVTINQAVSIVGAHGTTGVLAASTITGVTISAGPNDVISLRGLEVDGAGSGANGIQFISGASLDVQNSVIRGFTTGINFQSTTSGALSVSHTLITNNTTGIIVQSPAATSGVFNDVQMVNNLTGVAALGASATSQAVLTIQDSVIANNSTIGISSNGFSNITVSTSTIANNGVGLQAQNSGAVLQVSSSTVTGNGTGWQANNSGQLLSAATSSIAGNTTGNTAPPSTIASANTQTPASDVSAPVVLSKNIVTDFGAKCNGVADDNIAFTAFNTWAKSQTVPIQLTIPSGSVCMFSAVGRSGNWFARGIKNLVVLGYGATISDNNGAGNGFFLGGEGVFQDNAHSARVATVTAGSTSVTLQNSRQASLFAVGSWALITGLDMMGYGFPPNPAFFEYVKITGVNSTTGQITFTGPLQNTYKSTWPLYNAGSEFNVDMGGPATLYALDPSWDTTVEYRGLTISQAGQTYANGKNITYRDVKFTGAACGIPSQNFVWNAINVDMSSCNIEVDKLVDNMSISGTTIRQMAFQSSSINLFVMNTSVVTNALNGTPKKAAISDSTLASFGVGSQFFGRTEEVVCTNCTINDMAEMSATDKGGSNNVGINNFYSMNNGVIASPNSNGPLPWAIPGANITWMGRFPQESPTFQVVDVTQDATNIYVRTNLTGGWPVAPQYNGLLSLRVHAAPKFTCTNCVGSADAIDLSGAPPGIPLWSYSKRTYTGNTIASLMPVWGKIVSTKFSVITPYRGSSSLNFNLNGPFVIAPDGATTNIWDPKIDPKISGTRTVTASSISGVQATDSVAAPGTIWWVSNQVTPQFSTNINGQDPTTWPTVTVEITTDQGVVAP